ncbi:hypothetical protein [Oricola cellulosilytica]|uniref:Flagellar protein FlgN n=1 Tax=Oricola cellulosilytica TaxID=1429082 RepID=A0A4R0PI61_9HYPH|nr:hypothetical protein [Oricola cellulosilytica]TCD16230.1 hypothetical protein E0D97_02015 [Oricola cellulosilytica]
MTVQNRDDSQKGLTKTHLMRLLVRIGQIIDAETRLLGENPRADLAAANARKNRCLYELNLVSRDLARFELDGEVRREIMVLGRKVQQNEAMLRANIEATKEVIGILGDAITHAESDGTYASGSRLPAGYQ